MAEHIAYDTDKRIIYITTAPVNGEVVIDVKVDLYSDMKEDWLADSTLNKFKLPISSVGGNPLPGDKDLGATFFLDNEWKIRPYEANHALRINGNLYSEDGTSVVIPTIGNYNVLVEMTVSNLSDSTIAQLSEIEYSSFNGGVTIDVTSSNSGVGYTSTGLIIGTPMAPVNNVGDAYSIVVDRGLPPLFYVIGNLHLTDAIPDLDGFSFYGSGMDRTTLNIDPNANVTDCAYYDAHVTGTLDGNSKLEGCIIDNLIYVKGYIQQCVLSPGTIVLAGNETAHFLDCYSGVPGTGTPTIDLGGSGQALALRNYNGGIKLKNKSGNESVSIDLNSGQIKLASDITNGDIVLRGVGTLTEDFSNGANVINQLINTNRISEDVWDEELTKHRILGTMGNILRKILYRSK